MGPHDGRWKHQAQESQPAEAVFLLLLPALPFPLVWKPHNPIRVPCLLCFHLTRVLSLSPLSFPTPSELICPSGGNIKNQIVKFFLGPLAACWPVDNVRRKVPCFSCQTK